MDLINELVSQFNRLLPAGSGKAWVNCEISNNRVSLVGFYSNNEADTGISNIHIPSGMGLMFARLRDEADSKKQWNSATIILESGGEFSMDYSYESFSDSSQLERRKSWKSKYLPV